MSDIVWRRQWTNLGWLVLQHRGKSWCHMRPNTGACKPHNHYHCCYRDGYYGSQSKSKLEVVQVIGKGGLVRATDGTYSLCGIGREVRFGDTQLWHTCFVLLPRGMCLPSMYITAIQWACGCFISSDGKWPDRACPTPPVVSTGWFSNICQHIGRALLTCAKHRTSNMLRRSADNEWKL